MPLARRWSLILVLMLAAHSALAAFTVEEYEQWRQYDGQKIRVVEFPGIRSFSRGDLFAIMEMDRPAWYRRYVRFGHRATFYADQFASDIIRIQRFYSREGFPDAKVKGYVSPGPRDLKLKFEISEGRPLILTAWNAVFLSDTGAAFDSVRWSKLMPIKIGKRLALSDVKASADTIRYKLNTLGHARAVVDYEIRRDTINYTVQLSFLLRPRHFSYFGNTRIWGLKQIEEETVRREITYHIGDPYDIRELEKTRRRIVRQEAFTLVSVLADTSVAGDVLPVNIRTQEGSRYRIRAGAGYHSVERARGQVEFTDLNFFGRGRRLTWDVSYAEFHRLTEIRLFWPHTPLNRTDLTLTPKWEWTSDPLFRLETRTGRTTLSAVPGEFVTVSLSNEAGSSIRKDTVRTRYTTSVESFGIAWDTRDNPLVPRHGHFLGATLKESGMFYGERYRYWKAILQARVLIPQGNWWTLVGKTEFDYVNPLYGTNQTPIEERFTLYGPTTLRGWDPRRPLSPRDAAGRRIGGDLAWSATAEVRRNIWGPAAAAIFVDVGNVWSRPYRVEILNLYPSVGLGLLVVTPVGPVRADFGYQLRPNPYHEQRWALHLSLGSPF